MEITRISSITGLKHTMDIPVTKEQLDKWNEGMHIQHAMPNIPAEQREFLMTGITPDEWDAVFGKEEEDA